MRKIYYLSTCTTCERIMNDLNIGEDVILRDVKTAPVTVEELDYIAKLTGGYGNFFSRIAKKYRMWGLKDMDLKEADYKKYMLQEYTFIKRPVVIIDDKVFVGSSRPVLLLMKKAFNEYVVAK